MATFYITEYQSIARNMQVPQEPPVAVQTVAISGSSTASAVFSPNTNLVRIETDAICSFRFGVSPSATTTDARMAADQVEFRGVAPGLSVAVITNT